MTIEKNASNQSGGTMDNANSFVYTSSYGTVTKVTSIVREFDKDGKLAKETETVTEYDNGWHSVPYQPYPYQYPPFQPYIVTYDTASAC